MILVGTDRGLTLIDGPSPGMEGLSVTAIARAGDDWWTVVDGSEVYTVLSHENVVNPPAGVNCIADTSPGVFLGLTNAGLWRTRDRTRRAQPSQADEAAVWQVDSFERVPGRDGWYTPWGGPPDTRSITEAADGTLHVNVHVGGIPRSRDGGETWEPTIDVDTDVHQVLAHPTDPNLILAPCAFGLAVSRDGGDAYEILTDGFHANYSRAVAISGDTVLVTVSRSHAGQQAAIYRAPLALDRPFEKCTAGLPEWFGDNIDTGCLDANDERIAFGTSAGEVFVSEDAGSSWERAWVATSPVRAVAIG